MNIMDEKKLRDSEFAMYECRIILEKQFSARRYESVIVDEGQDLSPSAFRLIRALAGEGHKFRKYEWVIFICKLYYL